MKKIIISNKQLAETVSPVQPQELNVTQQLYKAGIQAKDNARKGYDPSVITNTGATTNDTVTITAGDNGLKQTDVPKALKAKNIIVTPEKSNNSNDILSTNTIMEKAYSKKHIEEVRKSNGRVMTKRELMESWGVAGNGTINDVYEIINNKKNEYQNKFQKAIGSLTQVEEEIKNAINDIKSNLEDLGINVTGMEVECNDDDFEIVVKTDWVLKGDDYDENEEDYRKYKYLANVTGAEFSYYRIQQGYKTPYANQYSIVHFGLEDDKNPYFKIWGDIPDMNIEDNERY